MGCCVGGLGRLGGFGLGFGWVISGVGFDWVVLEGGFWLSEVGGFDMVGWFWR